MLPVIEQLLILQDSDRKIHRTQAELGSIDPQRKNLQDRLAAIQAQMEQAKLRVKQLESDRKKLELDAEAKKQQIDKYSTQQLQTRKNEEYKALSHEIDNCKQIISQLDDQQLVLMEQIEGAQKEFQAASQQINESRKIVEQQVSELGIRETVLKKELAEYQARRTELARDVEEGALLRYERLLKNKGDKVLVGIEHGVCGGCHMRLTTQSIVHCQGAQEIATCPNCGRILYYTRDMSLQLAD